MTRDQIAALEAAKAKISEIKLDLESLKDDIDDDADGEADAVGEVCSSLDTAEDEIDAAVKLAKENRDKPEEEKE